MRLAAHDPSFAHSFVIVWMVCAMISVGDDGAQQQTTGKIGAAAAVMSVSTVVTIASVRAVVVVIVAAVVSITIVAAGLGRGG